MNVRRILTNVITRVTTETADTAVHVGVDTFWKPTKRSAKVCLNNSYSFEYFHFSIFDTYILHKGVLVTVSDIKSYYS